MTPYELEILMWYFTRPGDPGQLGAPIGPSTAAAMLETGLLEENTAEEASARYRLAPRGKAYCEAVLAVPLPVQKWVLPSPGFWTVPFDDISPPLSDSRRDGDGGGH